MKHRLFTLALLAAAAFVARPAEAAINVDLELSLVVDVSGSVDNGEFILQRDAYEAAFLNPTIQNLIFSGGVYNKIAVNFIYFSTTAVQVVGWTEIHDVASATAFANAIGAAARPTTGMVGTATGIGNGIQLSYQGFATNNFDAARQVIDVSGDGANNTGLAPSTARDAALAAGIDTINGLVILGETGLTAHYTANVIGGTNADGNPAFVRAANGFAAFSTAIEDKLVAEIAQAAVPEPATCLIWAAGSLGLGLAAARRRGKLAA